MRTGRLRVPGGLATVLVRGRSMEPLLRDGDFLLVRHGAAVRPGDVVVARLHDRPGLLVVKRATSRVEGGWQLASDNVSAPGAVHGPGDVDAVVLARYWPRPLLRLRRRGTWEDAGPG